MRARTSLGSFIRGESLVFKGAWVSMAGPLSPVSTSFQHRYMKYSLQASHGAGFLANTRLGFIFDRGLFVHLAGVEMCASYWTLGDATMEAEMMATAKDEMVSRRENGCGQATSWAVATEREGAKSATSPHPITPAARLHRRIDYRRTIVRDSESCIGIRSLNKYADVIAATNGRVIECTIARAYQIPASPMSVGLAAANRRYMR